MTLIFVNRVPQVETILFSAQHNWNRGKPDKPLISYSAQLMGSGKTYFGENIQQKIISLSNNTNPTPEASTDMKVLKQINTAIDSSVMKQFLEAKYIYVDLTKDLSHKLRTFDEALYTAIWKKANLSIDDFPKDWTPANFIKELKEKCGKDSIFLIVDEVGKVVDLTVFYKDLEPPVIEPTDSSEEQKKKKKQNLTKPYHVLFEYISSFADLKGIFLYVCGKSTELTTFSESTVTQSPVRLQRIHLPTLNEEYINQILMGTMVDGESLEKKINLSSKLRPNFINMMYEYTRGVPRLLSRCFEYLNANPLKENCTNEELSKVFETSLYSHVKGSFGVFLVPKGTPLEVNMMNCYRLCIYLNLMDFSFGEAQIIETTQGNMISLINAMSDLCIYYERAEKKPELENIYAYEDEKGVYKVVFPKFFLKYLRENKQLQLEFFSGLLSQYSAVMDQGRSLEVILAHQLYYQLKPLEAKTYGVHPLFQDTLFSKCKIASLRFGAVKSMYAATEKFTKESTSYGTTKEGWKMFFDEVENDTIYIRDKKNSESEDLGIKSFDEKGPKMALIASKNLQSKSATNWKDIQKEIDKSLNPISEYLKIPAVLFIISTHLTQEIEKSLESQRIVWKGGEKGAKLWVDPRGGKLVQKSEKTRGNMVLTLPPRTELVVLSKQEVERLISEKCFEKLSKFTILTCEDLVDCIGGS
jgi:hypothetical protein